MRDLPEIFPGIVEENDKIKSLLEILMNAAETDYKAEEGEPPYYYGPDEQA